tara:strand:- start:184 stop:483 length:300 start_codon:yes stop_codon:yes gene_type:complete
MGSIKEQLGNQVEQVLSEYGLVIACLVIGIIIGWNFKVWVADRKYNKQINLRFEEKDQRIAELNYIILSRLNKIKVKKQDKTFFKRLKKYFKKFRVKNK